MGGIESRPIHRRGTGGDRDAAHRPDHRRRAVPRRDRRLAHGGALPLRCAGPRTVGARRPSSLSRTRLRRRRHLDRRRHDVPVPRCRRSTALDRRPGRSGGDRQAGARGGRRLGPVHVAVSRGRRPGAAAATETTRLTHTVVVTATPRLGSPLRGQAIRVVPDRARDLPGGPPGPLRSPCAGGRAR